MKESIQNIISTYKVRTFNRNKTTVINLVIFNIIADSLLSVHGGKIKIDFLK